MSNAIKASDFVHLHNHTHHSVLDGLQKIPKMVDRTKELGMEAIAITDHGTMSGAIEFYKAAKAADINPIIGMEAYVATRKHTDRDPLKDRSRFHLILLAMNNVGYENLMRLSTIANLEGFYHKPRIDHDLLEKYNEGLIVLSGCIGGEVGENLRYDQDDKAEEVAKWYKSVFGDRYYFELQDHGYQWDEQAKVNKKLAKLAKKLSIELALTSDAHYLKHEDQEAHEVLLCVQTGSYLSEQNRMSLKDTDLYLADPKDIVERWSEEYPEAITNTKKIADRCNIEIDLGGILIPNFPLPNETFTEKSYLHLLVYQGLCARYTDEDSEAIKKLSTEACKELLSAEVIARAKEELDIIGSMGFEGYFLIVQDFIIWGKDRGIVFGPGRGSAAGSIVAYSLKITDLDPLEFDLLFERFLNPDRISMPDIDIDIQDSRRDEVIQYCVDKYGQDRVAAIVTFGKMAARNAIRDVSRVLEVPYAEADRLAKMVPPPVQGRHIPLEKSLKDNPELREENESNPQSARVFELAVKLEGTIRSHGVHAAGVVIAPDDIVKYTPLEMSQKGSVATQYAMNPVEELGLLKMDFLGLSNLTIVNNSLRIIKRVYGEDLDITKLPMDDKPTYDLLGRGETTGVFQFESGGMKRYLKSLKPDVFDDVIAMGALYRPGPLGAGLTDKYINRKLGKEEVTYDHPKMKDALANTYGVMVYQEQVMQIAKDMCGFTGGQADTLRKAIGKKITKLMDKLKVEFVEGGVEHSGANAGLMEQIWRDIEGFADYAFNKSHSACYGMISYWTAYLKAHYPAAFMAAVMTSDYNDTDRLAIEISECQHMGIDVLAPDVNESFVEFGVVKETGQIRFGMQAIKNVGTAAADEIVRVREKDGPYKSVEDFVTRVSTRVVNKKSWESLIKAGAFDAFGGRNKLLFNMDKIVAYGAKAQKEALSGQTNLFAEVMESALPSIKIDLSLDEPPTKLTEKEVLQWERELLGLYLSKHPLDGYDEFLTECTQPIGDITKRYQDKSVVIGGVISTLREITTKKGQKMAFVGLEDKTGQLELIVFPGVYEDNRNVWVQDQVIVVKGKVNTKDRDGRSTEEIKVLVDKADEVPQDDFASLKKKYRKSAVVPPPASSKTIEKSKFTPPAATVEAKDIDPKQPRLFIHVKDPEQDRLLISIKQTLDLHPGNTEVVVVLRDKTSAIRLPCRVSAENELKLKLGNLVGAEGVVLS